MANARADHRSRIAKHHELKTTIEEQLGNCSFLEKGKISEEIINNRSMVYSYNKEPQVAFKQTVTNLLELRTETT